MGLNEKDSIAVYKWLNVLIETGYSNLNRSLYSKAQDQLLCIMKRLDKKGCSSDAQIIVKLLEETRLIVLKKGDRYKADGLEMWVKGIRDLSVRRERMPNSECPKSYQQVGLDGVRRDHFRSRASQAAIGKHIYQHGLQQFKSTSEGRSRQVLFTEGRRRSGARPLRF